MYTGMTSANSDESLVGFVLVNLRTKEPRYYTCAGATRILGHVVCRGPGPADELQRDLPAAAQHRRPSHVLPVAQGRGGPGQDVRVRRRAAVPDRRYGSTVADAQNAYIAALTNDDQVEIDEGAIAESGILPSVDGQIEAIESVVFDGNTRYYFKLAGDPKIYIASISANENMPFLGPGCTGVGDVHREGQHARGHGAHAALTCATQTVWR